MIEFAIDLIWVRYGKIGGGVAVVLNLLDGLLSLKNKFKIYLVVTKDNRLFFSKFIKDERFNEIVVNVNSLNRKQTVLYQNVFLASLLKKKGIGICLEPDNYIPIINRGNIKYITVIHDLQGMHYPRNFTLAKNLWMRLNWKNAFHFSKKIVAISNFTKKDILSFFNVRCDIQVIYNPICFYNDGKVEFESFAEKLGIKKYDYYYTVSSMDANKNLITLLKMMKILKDRGIRKKLVISGVGTGKKLDMFISIVNDMDIADKIVMTGFVSSSIRDSLYEHCELFLFPSIFEGFGMPPLEAAYFGSKVLTTKMTSIPEATQNAVGYVDNPFDAVEWAEKVLSKDKLQMRTVDFDLYSNVIIAEQYLKAIESL